MQPQQWLQTNANKVPSSLDGDNGTVWVTNDDRQDYITRVGMENDSLVKAIASRDLTQVQSTYRKGGPVNIGFNAAENKWYGWSHRAIGGFTIGSEVKKGDLAYCAANKDDFLEDMVRFWSDDNKINVTGEHRKDGVQVTWQYDDKVPNKDLRGQNSGHFAYYPEQYGRGEWVAETIEDAKAMAIDFSNNVS